MKWIPVRFAKEWVKVFSLYGIGVFTGLVLTRILLENEMTGSIITGFILLSTAIALIPSVVGYLGGRLFFVCYLIATIIGMLYMLIIIAGDLTPGWGDLTSIAGLFTLLGIGIGSGTIAEVVYYLLRGRKQADKR